MTMTTVDEKTRRTDGPTVVDAAIRFVASQPGGAERILLEHGRRSDGTCAGCLTSPVTWPCVVGVIATRALELGRHAAG
jgi:hypothetical protein